MSVIPNKKPQGKRRHKWHKPKFDRQCYKDRNTIERLIGWLENNRRLATRFDKLAFLKRYFKKLFSARP